MCLQFLYKYPQEEFPYDELVRVNGERGKKDREYELLDTGIFEDNHYFDVYSYYLLLVYQMKTYYSNTSLTKGMNNHEYYLTKSK